MPGYIEDRWWTKRPDPSTGEKRKTARYGQGRRYRVAGIPGVKDRSFSALTGSHGAKAWLAKAQHESTSGEFVDPRDGAILFRDYVEEHWWPDQTGDPATLATVKGRVWNHLLPHVGSLPLNGIKTPQLRALLKALEPKIGPSTTREVWGFLSAILQSAVDDERLRKNYVRSSKTIQLPTLPERKARAWPRDKVRAVQAGLKPRYRIMADLGCGAGLRQSEVFGLAEGDVDEAEGVIHVRRQVKKIGSKLVFALPKGGKTRDVPAPPHLLELLRSHLEAFPARKVTLPWKDPRPPQTEREAKERAAQTHALVVTGVRGGALRRESFNSWDWKPALAAAGVIPEPEQVHHGEAQKKAKKYAEAREEGFHALRHTFASVHLHERENPVAVSKWLGHSDPSITLRIYGHMMPEADGRGRRAMDAWLRTDS